jgi:hypothetical protein
MIDTTDSLTAGPGLDRLIAEKVMGWKVRPCTCSPDHIAIDGRAEGVHFQPSTKIADAWEVMEFLGGKHGLSFGFAWPIHAPPLATFTSLNGMAKAYAFADSAPLAICRAALKAIGREQ